MAGARATGRLELVGEERQRPRRGDRRVLLAQAAGRGVAGVGELLFAALALALVQRREVVAGQEDLAAHLDARRRAGQALGHAGDRAHVGGHVLAGAPVAARRRAGQRPALVGDGEREAVDLGLDDDRHVGRVDAEVARGALAPLAQLVDVEDVVEAQHRRRVRDRGEGRRRGGADRARRRVLGGELGVVGLERAQLAHQGVVVGVGDRGRVVDEVGLVVGRDLLAQPAARAPRGHAHEPRHRGAQHEVGVVGVGRGRRSGRGPRAARASARSSQARSRRDEGRRARRAVGAPVWASTGTGPGRAPRAG